MLPRLEEEAPGDAPGAQGGPPADPPPTPADPPPADPPADPPAPAAVKNSLAAGADAGDDPPADPPAPNADGRPDWLPAKYWDAEAKEIRAEQLAKSYGELERRFRTDGAELPADPTGYKIELADGEELAIDDEAAAEFAQFAHTIKLDNGQYNAIVREYQRGVVQAVESVRQVEAENTQKVLLEQHGDEKAVRQVHRAAYQAFAKFATADELAIVGELPDHPALVNVLARIGAALSEDTPPGAANVSAFETQTQDVDRIYRDAAGPYYNAAHPDHERVVAQVRAWEEACAKRGVNSLELRRNLHKA